MQDATGGFSGCNFWQVAALEREKEAVLTCLGANRLFHDVLHLRGEDFYLQEVHGKTESGPILKGVAVFFNTMDVHVVSGGAVMLQHAATSLAGASIKR